MEELTSFGKENSLTLPSLADKYFNSLRDGNDGLIYTYTDSFVSNFVLNSIKGCRCNAFHQHYKSQNSDEVFINILWKINVIGII